MSNGDRPGGVPTTVTSIPLIDPKATATDPSVGALVKDVTSHVSTLVRGEVELAKAEIVRDIKKALTGSLFFVVALVVLLYSSFFLFFAIAEVLAIWLHTWAAYLIVFGAMVLLTVLLALLGYLKVRRIRGPRQTIASVKQIPSAFTGDAEGAAPGSGPGATPTAARPAGTPARDTSGW